MIFVGQFKESAQTARMRFVAFCFLPVVIVCAMLSTREASDLGSETEGLSHSSDISPRRLPTLQIRERETEIGLVTEYQVLHPREVANEKRFVPMISEH